MKPFETDPLLDETDGPGDETISLDDEPIVLVRETRASYEGEIARGLRQKRAPSDTRGGSWWTQSQSREELLREANARSRQMSSSREGRMHRPQTIAAEDR